MRAITVITAVHLAMLIINFPGYDIELIKELIIDTVSILND